MIAQYDTAGTRQAWYTQSLARIDEVLNVVNASGKFWYQSDALGSVYALTTQGGEVRARGGYDVFGESVALSGTAVGQPFGFTGREHEADSGLVYARARYARPASGRWLAPDPLGFVDGPNRYAYVQANPTIYTDPSGQVIFVDSVRKGIGMFAASAEQEAGIRLIGVGLVDFNPMIVAYGLSHLMTGIYVEVLNGGCPALTPQGRGLWVEERVSNLFRSAGYVVQRGRRIMTPFGERVVDLVVFRPGTTVLKFEDALFTIEVKFGRFAKWDKIQRVKDLFIENVSSVIHFVVQG
ncbi:MAG: RHS repeat-associated core domain-containing protein [Anaeromyxobacteraceae bacterium]